MDNNIIYDINHLRFTWDSPKTAKHGTAKYIIENFDAQLCKKQLVACIGKNGSGKSTFLKILAGLNRRYEGDITFCGEILSKCRPRELARKMSYMAQIGGDMPPFTVREIVDMGNYAKARSSDSSQNKADTENAIRLTGITFDPDKPFRELSGGQQQRVMLARAVCQSSKVMLLDEPLSGLDIVAKESIMKMLRNIADTQDSLIILSTHDIGLAVQYADSILSFYGTTPQMMMPAELNDTKIKEIFSE
jgi:iron complex transport system ATP-binding protein